ncbi:hypothetical protein N8737_04855 [Verrucomicrobia bacterium]|jgi:hypothetical protein|nr:hypothetical protein [Verrucomicrobiota bacterium]MDA7658008.1 hypothetical protein [Verrucomicrobiota bacterium]
MWLILAAIEFFTRTEVYDAIPQLMTEAPSKQLEQQIQAVDVTQIRLAQQLRVS